MLKTSSIPETIVQRKVIVFKPAFGIKEARKCAEKAKNQMFTKYLILKSKPEETKIDSLDKYFEPYLVVDGEYSIDYSKKWNYSIQVDEEMQKLKINNKNFEPKFLKNHLELPYKLLELQGTGRFYHESRVRLIFDQKWNEVGFEELPYLPFEESQETFNKNDYPHLKNELDAEKEVEILRAKIFKRPTEIKKIYDELFNVTERALIFKPMYKVIASHTKTQNKVTFLIDGVNGKITSDRKEKFNLNIEETLKEVVSKLYSISKSKIKDFINFFKDSREKYTTQKNKK